MPLAHRVAIRSKILGETIWLLPDNVPTPEDLPPDVVCYHDRELEELDGLSPEDLRTVHIAKKATEGEVVPKAEQPIVQIDDAGWGSLVGGVLIGGYRTDTDEFDCVEVSVQNFQGSAYSQRKYVEAGVEAFEDLVSKMDIGRDDTIEICQGARTPNHCLYGIPEILKAKAFRWRYAKIEGPLQVLVETTLLERVRALGIQTDYETLTTKQGLYFHQCVMWLHGGDAYKNRKSDPEHESLCKTGWPTFRIWADYSYKTAQRLAKEHKAKRSRERLQDYDR